MLIHCLLLLHLVLHISYKYHTSMQMSKLAVCHCKQPISSLVNVTFLGFLAVLRLTAATQEAEMHLLAHSGGRHKRMDGCQLLIVTVLQNGCCFNILYRFLCNTLTCARQPQARINSAQRIRSSSPFVKSQSCFNDAWRNIQALTFCCQVSLEKSIKIIQLWPSYPVNAY